jgi:hypothetical protein
MNTSMILDLVLIECNNNRDSLALVAICSLSEGAFPTKMISVVEKWRYSLSVDRQVNSG